jgi:hypothetical protein
MQIWVNLGGSCKESCWLNLWTFFIFYSHLVYFSRFGMLFQEKSGSPAHERKMKLRLFLGVFSPNFFQI